MRLVMEHLSKQFKNRIAVESIDTELREGVYGFLGANGAGKTTLMQMICGIIEPTAGEVKINGENNIQMGERFRDMLGYLPQEFGYTPGFTAHDFMLYIASIKGLPPRFAKRKTKELLKLVNLEKDAGRKIRTFSGGMKRRLGIADSPTRPSVSPLYIFRLMSLFASRVRPCDAANLLVTCFASSITSLFSDISFTSPGWNCLQKFSGIFIL